MRLYIKLFLFITITTVVQQSFFSKDESSQVWFGFRCQYAYLMHDNQMIERLIVEARAFNFLPQERRNVAGG